MRLPASLRATFYTAAAALMGSGIVWLAMHYELLPAGESGATVMLEVHGAAAMVVLFLSGSLLALHAPRAWRQGRNRPSGVLVGALLVAVASTGYLLYYASDDAVRASASLVHWLVGVLAAALVWLHGFLGRRSAAP
jgi:hypothetical protein